MQWKEVEECERGFAVVQEQKTDAAAIELPESQACMCGQWQIYNMQHECNYGMLRQL